VAVNPTGGPVLGSGGTGDVLAGLTGALLAQGAPAFEAAALAAFVHGAAGDGVAARRGARGALASEIADAIPEMLRALGEPQPLIGAGDAIRFPEPG
jgi:NAD(P)H-hydrate epimerase